MQVPVINAFFIVAIVLALFSIVGVTFFEVFASVSQSRCVVTHTKGVTTRNCVEIAYQAIVGVR
jgi:hypothetical protein